MIRRPPRATRLYTLAPRTTPFRSALEGGDTFDVIADLAYPLPVIVVSRILGVPREDHACLKAWSARLTGARSEEQTSELQSLMRSSYAVFCLKKKHKTMMNHHNRYNNRNTISTIV